MTAELRTTLTGDALKTERLALGLTQRALAQRLGVAAQSISDWETGRKTCQLPGLLRLALDHLGCAPSCVSGPRTQDSGHGISAEICEGGDKA